MSVNNATPRTAYVLKMYPRFSETFIVNEVIAREQAGDDIDLFALRPSNDVRFHATLAQVHAQVYYAPRIRSAETLWNELAETAALFPTVTEVLPELLREDPEDAAQAMWIARAAHARGITHFHAHFATAATTVARLASLITGIPYSFTAHAKDIFHDDVRPEDLRRKLTDAAFTVTVSDYNLAFLRTHYGAAASRVRRVYNGVDLDTFRYHEPAGLEPSVLAVGRLVEKKGFEDLVRAMRIIAAYRPQVRCRIIGSGPLEASLTALIEEYGVADCVELVGPLPQHQVREELARATVFVAPCVVGSDGNQDGLPTVLLEAMAMGTPCISTPVTGITEAVEHGVTGMIVPEHNPEQLATAIEAVLDDPQLQREFAAAARAHVVEHFDVRRQAFELAANQLGETRVKVPA